MSWNRLLKKSKYGAVRSGDGFPSKLEHSVYSILELRQKAGEIWSLSRYPSVKLTKRVTWKVDFAFEDKRGPVFAEAKGVWTADARLKLNLWRDLGPAPLEIWRGSAQRPTLEETVYPDGWHLKD